MPHTRPHRDAAGDVVAKVFDRVTTEGDAVRFNAAEAGFEQMISVLDTSSTAEGLTRVTDEGASVDQPTAGSTVHTFLFNLDFEYIVGVKQLEVLIASPFLFSSTGEIALSSISSIDMKRQAEAAGWPGPVPGRFVSYFEEIGSSTVRVHGIAVGDQNLIPMIAVFRVPYTSTPAQLRNKVIVNDQGDNQAIELRGPGDGIILRAPNGTQHLVRIDDNGTIITEPR